MREIKNVRCVEKGGEDDTSGRFINGVRVLGGMSRSRYINQLLEIWFPQKRIFFSLLMIGYLGKEISSLAI